MKRTIFLIRYAAAVPFGLGTCVCGLIFGTVLILAIAALFAIVGILVLPGGLCVTVGIMLLPDGVMPERVLKLAGRPTERANGKAAKEAETDKPADSP